VNGAALRFVNAAEPVDAAENQRSCNLYVGRETSSDSRAPVSRIYHMFAFGTDRPLTLARLRDGHRAVTAIRKVLALRRSLGPLIYLISIGLIAIWIIGAFFGAGYLFLEHRPVDPVSSSAANSADQNAPTAQSGRTRDITAVQAGHPLNSGTIDTQNGAVFSDVKTSPSAPDEWVPKPEPQISVPAATETPSAAAQPARTAPSRHRHIRRPTHAQSVQPPQPGPQLRPPTPQTPQLRPPVQAIQDLFERHSDLAR
jgi:hypothetical protein